MEQQMTTWTYTRHLLSHRNALHARQPNTQSLTPRNQIARGACHICICMPHLHLQICDTTTQALLPPDAPMDPPDTHASAGPHAIPTHHARIQMSVHPSRAMAKRSVARTYLGEQLALHVALTRVQHHEHEVGCARHRNDLATATLAL